MPSLTDWLSGRFENITDALDRRIDNEIVGETLPAPGGQQNPTNERQVVLDASGRPKQAGAGEQLVPGVSNKVVIGAAALLAVGAVWLAVR